MTKSLKWFLCAALCAVLLLACLGTASAEEKITKGIYLDGGFILSDQWFYVADTVPEGLLAEQMFPTYLRCKDSDHPYAELPDSCEVTFVSGEAALKDALVLYSNGNQYFRVDNSQLTVPGQAVFHIKAESQHYVFDEDVTLTVLDWNEHPLLDLVSDHPVIIASPQEVIPFSKLIASVMKSHHDEIYQNVLNRAFDPDICKPWYGLSIEPAEGSNIGPAYSSEYDEEGVMSWVYGDFPLSFKYEIGNIILACQPLVSYQGYKVAADGVPARGETVQYSVVGFPEGRTFTWSVEGEGAAIDPASGAMTLAADAPAETVYTVTATAEDGLVLRRRVYFGGTKTVFDNVEFSQIAWEGFLIPVPEGDDWYTDDPKEENVIATGGGQVSEDNYLIWNAKWFLPDEGYAEDPEVALREIEPRLESFNNPANENVQTEIIQIDGHPAGLVAMRATEPYNKNYVYHAGDLIYIRNNRYLQVQLYFRNHVDNESKMETVTLADLKAYAHFLDYDETRAPLSPLKAVLSVSSKDGSDRVTAGKNLQMQAVFEHPELINSKEKNDGVVWTAVNAETGAEDPAVTITDKGQLKVDKSLAAPVTLQVKAVSAVFKTEASCTVTAVPVVTGISLEPAELFFYVGSDAAQNVRAILAPDTMPLTGITWTPAGQDLLEITPVEDGTVSIRPLKAGKTTVTVAEPSGKNAKLNVSVVAPVESVELSVKGKAKAGGTVTVSAALQPKDAGNKNVEWSLDVGEDVATINAKGQIKIGKGAASGTKITVTCKALGAPEPVVAAVEIEIP